MRSFFFLITIVTYCVKCTCPNGYTLAIDDICTHFVGPSTHTYDNMHSDVVNICKPDGATPVIIHNQEENDYWKHAELTSGLTIPLGLRCNTSTKAWEWDDGSSIDYKNFDSRTLPSGNCESDGYSWYLISAGTWYRQRGTAIGTWDVYCMKPDSPITPLTTIVPPDARCNDFMYDDEDGDCYQVGTSSETFLDAQTICMSFGANLVSVHDAQENSFVRRLAVSKGLINGVLIGATVSGKSDNFSWVDGSYFDYSNYEPGFPYKGMGDCLAMDTYQVNGHWVNVDCNQKMPFVCKRRQNDTGPICGESVYTEGELIYSPGFPNDASTPCDYFLPVDAKKLVELEILLLDADTCCDHLVLYEGSIGGTIIANLTGDVASGTKYRTTSSNMMRVSWQPNGGVNEKGAMFTFRGV